MRSRERKLANKGSLASPPPLNPPIFLLPRINSLCGSVLYFVEFLSAWVFAYVYIYLCTTTTTLGASMLGGESVMLWVLAMIRSQNIFVP